VPLRSSPITGPSTLLRAPPSLCPASVLSLLQRLSAYTSPLTSGRQVLTFLTEARYRVTPPSCRAPVEQSAGIPRPSSRAHHQSPVSTPSEYVSTPHRRFIFIRLSVPHLTRSMPRLFLNAHHQGSLPQQLEVVWSLLLQTDSEGPTLIFNKAPQLSVQLWRLCS